MLTGSVLAERAACTVQRGYGMTSPMTTTNPTTSAMTVTTPMNSSLNAVPLTTSLLGPVPPTSRQKVRSCHCRTRCHSGKRCPCKKLKVPCTMECHPGHTCTNCNASAVKETVDLTLKTTPQSPQRIILDVALSPEQKSILSSKAWLDDKLIDMGQSLLKA